MNSTPVKKTAFEKRITDVDADGRVFCLKCRICLEDPTMGGSFHEWCPCLWKDEGWVNPSYKTLQKKRYQPEAGDYDFSVGPLHIKQFGKRKNVWAVSHSKDADSVAGHAVYHPEFETYWIPSPDTRYGWEHGKSDQMDWVRDVLKSQHDKYDTQNCISFQGGITDLKSFGKAKNQLIKNQDGENYLGFIDRINEATFDDYKMMYL